MLSFHPRVGCPPGSPVRLGSLRLGVVLLILVMVACSRRPVATGPAIPLPPEEAASLLEDLEQYQQSIVRYQAILRVRGEGPEGRFSATEILVFERPDRVRVELLATFGSSRWIAVTDGGEITVLFPRTREYLRESEVEEVVSALLGIRLQPEEVMAILSGSGMPLSQAEPDRAERLGEQTRITFGGDSRLMLQAGQVREAVVPDYRVRYPTDWKERGRTAPERIEITNDRIEASLTVEELDINVPLDPEAFTVSLPDGVVRLGVAEIEGEAVFVRPNP